VVFGDLLDLTGSWMLPRGSITLLLMGAALSFYMRPDQPFAGV